MNTLFSLSLSASLLVVMLYPVFHILVNRCRSFRFNRLLMLSGIGIIILASIALAYEPATDAAHVNASIHTNIIRSPEITASEAVNTTAEASRFEVLPWIISLYWIGVFVLVARQIISYTHLWRIISKSEKQRIDGYVLCRHKSMGIAPFSWGRFIVLPLRKTSNLFLSTKKHIR